MSLEPASVPQILEALNITLNLLPMEQDRVNKERMVDEYPFSKLDNYKNFLQRIIPVLSEKYGKSIVEFAVPNYLFLGAPDESKNHGSFKFSTKFAQNL